MSTAFPPFAPLLITVPGAMTGKGRPRAAVIGGRARMFTPRATENAEAWVKHCAVSQVGQPCLEGPLELEISIAVEVPASWSKRKRAEALDGTIWPTGKPDIDNAAKLCLDSLNKIVWRDDAQVVVLRVRKHYAAEPFSLLRVSRPEAVGQGDRTMQRTAA